MHHMMVHAVNDPRGAMHVSYDYCEAPPRMPWCHPWARTDTTATSPATGLARQGCHTRSERSSPTTTACRGLLKPFLTPLVTTTVLSDAVIGRL
jgi:hypothetical protein